MSAYDGRLDEGAVAMYLRENAALREALGIACDATPVPRLLARGEYNVNYVFAHPHTGASLLFRVNLGSQMHLKHQIEYEARALDLLSSSGRTPRVLFVDGSRDFFGAGVLVEECLPGSSLRYESDLPEAARILADIHSVALPEQHGLVAPEHPLADIVRECDQMFSVYRRSECADAETVARVEAFFAVADEAVRQEGACGVRHIVNTELNSRNFLINKTTGGYLIDWEKPIAAPVEQDIAHFLVPTTTLWKTDTVLDHFQHDAFIEAYCEAVGGRFDVADVAARSKAYLASTCLRGITWCAMAFAERLSYPEKTTDAFTLERINGYISKDFLIFIEREYFSERLL